MKLNVQLHLHTIESKTQNIPAESVIHPKLAIDTAKKNGIDVIAVTDHNTTRKISSVKDFAEKKGIIIIKGIEIDTDSGHLIGFGVDEEIEKKIKLGIDLLETADLIKDFGGEVYIPHPFDIRKKGVGPRVKEVDGIIEVFNSMNIFGFENKYADIVADKLKKPKAVGADAHTLSMIPRCITVVDAEPDEYSIIKNIKQGNVEFKNCTYMTLREFKEWILTRISLSYDDIIKSIQNGWEPDEWYTILANSRLIKPLEKAVLEFGIRTKKSRLWDFVTYSSYIFAYFYSELSKREFNAFICTL